MRLPRLTVAMALCALTAVGCAAAPSTNVPFTALSASAVTTSGSKAAVTVPGLGGVSAGSVAAAESVAVSGAETAAPVGSDPASPAVGPEYPVSVSSGVAPVAVDLTGCADCEVLGTRAAVVGTYAVALITRGGRANLLSLEPTGAVVGSVNVLYGATFPAPADGQLACGAGGRCVLVGVQPDGRAILSTYQLTDTGAWVDLSGTTGFVSATAKGLPVLLEDTYGAAIQVGDGTTTVWTVLAWNGTIFGSIGCTPDADAPDLTRLDPGLCLS